MEILSKIQYLSNITPLFNLLADLENINVNRYLFMYLHLKMLKYNSFKKCIQMIYNFSHSKNKLVLNLN